MVAFLKNLFRSTKPCTPDSHKEEKQIPFFHHLKALIITDTHSSLMKYWVDQIPDKEKLRTIDVVLVLGDVTGLDILDVEKLITENNLPCFGIPGNHDENWDPYKGTHIQNLHGKVIFFKGIRIGGMGGSIRYKDSDNPLLTDEEASGILEQMEGCDILLTHDGVKHPEKDFAHSGLAGISEYLEKWKVPYHFYGHFHQPMEENLPNGTKSICFYGVTMIEL